MRVGKIGVAFIASLALMAAGGLAASHQTGTYPTMTTGARWANTCPKSMGSRSNAPAPISKVPNSRPLSNL